MRDSHGLPIEAARFMPAVSRIRYQSTLDKWVFAEILRLHKNDHALRRRMESGGFTLTMNCDPGLLIHQGLASEWLGVFEKEGFDPRSLVVEVVENPILFENTELSKNIHALRAEGVRIAVDDFGSGYSNLRHLAGLPVDIVKFDRGFLQGFGGSESREGVLLETMLKLCAELGYETVCEGVETQAHADFLGRVGCRCAQGYFYGKPMPMGDVLSLAQKYDVAAEALERCHTRSAGE
jgi:EAL domain-containing protein (putative c-di-GMP-specific phosphodiesterase class I)